MCKLAFLDLSVNKEEFSRGPKYLFWRSKKLIKIFKCGSLWLKFRKSVADANENFKSLIKSADFTDKKMGPSKMIPSDPLNLMGIIKKRKLNKLFNFKIQNIPWNGFRWSIEWKYSIQCSLQKKYSTEWLLKSCTNF